MYGYICINSHLVKKPLAKKLLNSKLNFDEHNKRILDKISISVGLICKLQSYLPTSSLLQIYKSFVRPYLYHGPINYNKAFVGSFQQKLESIQYNTALQ